jgi:hypothetical protein
MIPSPAATAESAAASLGKARTWAGVIRALA